MTMPGINEITVPFFIIELDLNKWDTFLLAIIWELRAEPDVYVRFDKLNRKIDQLGRTPNQIANSVQRLKDAGHISETTEQKWTAALLLYDYVQ